MVRKTTRIAKALINQHKENTQHFSKEIDRGTKPENDDFLIGYISGQTKMLESILQESNCYYGFMYVDKDMNGPIDNTHPDMAYWRVVFFIRKRLHSLPNTSIMNLLGKMFKL